LGLGGPLGGVAHLGGSDVTSTLPRVLGSRNLHEETKDLPPDFFIMTSSVSGILGTLGQSNYAVDNTYIDQLAHTLAYVVNRATF
jgi:hypothetical protein